MQMRPNDGRGWRWGSWMVGEEKARLVSVPYQDFCMIQLHGVISVLGPLQWISSITVPQGTAKILPL